MLIKLQLCGLFNILVYASDIFHVNSKSTFYSNSKNSDYFGYSVLLTGKGLIVGAPKARKVVGITAGNVFTCPLTDLSGGNKTCNPLKTKLNYILNKMFNKHDSWFGATLADSPDGTLFACAPQIKKTIDEGDNIKVQSSDGACYVHGNKTGLILSILDRVDKFNETKRKDYASYFASTHMQTVFQYQRYAFFGMSITYTKDNTVVIGAPNVMEGAGSLFHFKYHLSSNKYESLTSPNPYFTNELKPDDYFGYSVVSGIFEKDGPVLYVGGAPRSKKGYGQVLIIEKPEKETASLKIKAQLTGPHLGSYFGSSLCTADLNMDGVSDLLVGAPNYVLKSGVLTYDQGAVFVYMTRKTAFGFVLEETGVVRGSGASGARFGTSIADLGDIDGDGFADIAVGAPWESNGVVYIYKGTKTGLTSQYSQRILADGSKGFGFSLSSREADNSGCNDLAIGAYGSDTAYLYRCIPTRKVLTSIKVPDLKNLKNNANNFTALFCMTVKSNSWTDFEIRVNAKVTVDPDRNRAKIIGNSTFEIIRKTDLCTPKTIEINTTADFSRPLVIQFDITPARIDALPEFPSNKARLSEDSNLQSSIQIQMLSDCGDDICMPWLLMDIKPWKSPYTPGVDAILGFNVSVTNTEEPAFQVKLHLVLPHPPQKLPESCTLRDLDLTCDLPAPLNRNQMVEWEIQLEYIWDGVDTEFLIEAELKDPLYMRNITQGTKELIIPIVPQFYYNLSGKVSPNATIYITRYSYDKKEDVYFTHYYEVTNIGPSDLYNMKIEFSLAKEISLANTIEGATVQENNATFILPYLKAERTMGYTLPLLFNVTQLGKILRDSEVINVTTKLFVYVPHGSGLENRSLEITTLLVLEPSLPLWPLIVACVTGLLILIVIMLVLYKCKFFTRPKKEDLKQLVEDQSSQVNPRGSSSNQSSIDGRSSIPHIGE